jgi:hypothetical protein
VTNDSVTQSSYIPLNEIKVNTDGLQQIPVKARAVRKGSFMTCRTLTVAVCLICTVAIVAIALALVYSLKAHHDHNCRFLISTVS